LHAELVRRGSDLAGRMAFMTGGAYTPEARRLLASVSNPCIDKPFGPAELTSVVDQLLRGEPVSEGDRLVARAGNARRLINRGITSPRV
jgi:hypothetical protein